MNKHEVIGKGDMNRIVLIGNGFDLAHGLKTSYANFINWYWEQWGRRLLTGDHNIESDELCSFILKPSEYYSTWYQFWVGPYIQKPNPFAPWNPKDVVTIARNDERICLFKYITHFFEQINNSIETKGWVDIENEYYSMLVQEKDYGDRVKTLNKQLDFLREKLIEYLNIENGKGCMSNDEIKDKIYRPIKEREIAIAHGIIHKNPSPENVLLLNFNYTNTPQMYVGDNANVNYIHGMLKYPQSVIFGYGDELDENYKKLQNLNDNECLRNIKSIRYLELDCYRNILRFIESAPFQICIMGHSCGNSDRTLLNTLFEHRNCVSIKPYYYQKDDGSDNYNELVMNISRNFTDIKLMRDRVVCKDYCEPLTGVKPGVIVMG